MPKPAEPVSLHTVLPPLTSLVLCNSSDPVERTNISGSLANEVECVHSE